jgi:hypothetical protein
VEKYGRAGQTTEDNILWSRRVACWITKATKTRSEYVIAYCCSTAIVTRTCRNVMSVRTLSVVVYVIYTTEFPLGDPDSRHTISPCSPDDRGTLQSFILGKAVSKF